MVNCQLPNANNSVENGIIYIAELLISYFCDQSDAYILQRDNITIARNIVAQVSFKNCAPFIKCITKIDRKTIHDAEDLDLVMPMYNLLEYSSNYSGTTGSLWFYSKDEATIFNINIGDTNNFKSFKYKTKLIRSTTATNGILENVKIAVPLKYPGNFWRSLKMPLVN